LGLSERAANVLFTALRAMGTLVLDPEHRLSLTPLAREHLLPGGAFYMGDYCGLAAESPGVLGLVERLRTSRPAGAEAEESGAAFIYREGIESAMEREASARHLTLALAGRAKNVAPWLARNFPLPDAGHLLDLGGGTGVYALALLQANPGLRATVVDRPEVLKVAAEFAAAAGVGDRLALVPGDMFTASLPPADVVLLSNILHDWDLPECRRLVQRAAAVLPPSVRPVGGHVRTDELARLEAVLREGESLTQFIEGAVCREADFRAEQNAAVARANPISYLVEAMRLEIIGGATVWTALVGIGIALGLAIITVGASALALRRRLRMSA
jgi:precorrin-6B methylase 2